MYPWLFSSVWGYLFGPLLAILSIFLILLILVQRGRGGGLAGALGGPGGQSAFGTRAGDVFTRITVVTFCIWLLLCILTVSLLNNRHTFRSRGTTRGSSSTELQQTAPPTQQGGASDQAAPSGPESPAPAGPSGSTSPSPPPPPASPGTASPPPGGSQ